MECEDGGKACGSHQSKRVVTDSAEIMDMHDIRVALENGPFELVRKKRVANAESMPEGLQIAPPPTRLLQNAIDVRRGVAIDPDRAPPFGNTPGLKARAGCEHLHIVPFLGEQVGQTGHGDFRPPHDLGRKQVADQ